MANATKPETKTATIHCAIPESLKRKIKARAATEGRSVPEQVALTLIAGDEVLDMKGASR